MCCDDKYDRIIVELLTRIEALEDKVRALETGGVKPQGSKRYRRLSEYLEESCEKVVRLSFDDIYKLVGPPIPASARKHQAFWANTKTHTIALSWMCVGYKVIEANIEQEYVIFEKENPNVTWTK
jgi:hypothetical protein